MIQAEGVFVSSGSAISVPIIGEDFNWTGGDGTCQVIDDGGGNWRIKFLSSGTFTPLKSMVVDVFLVGGGGTRLKTTSYSAEGGAGYTTTVRSVVLAAGTAYQVVVGAASASSTSEGGATTAFSAAAAGGKSAPAGSPGSVSAGGAGGSGGAGQSAGAGGIDGGNGSDGTTSGGKGQGTTTREFGETDGDLYAYGGGSNLTATVPNSGNGGTRTVDPANGIVVIRQHKEAAA